MLDIKPIGIIHSEIKRREDAPLFYDEGAPDATLEVYAPYAEALYTLKEGQDVVILTWLHESTRDVLQVHPRGDKSRPIRGVFTTRSANRPNPIGLHRATVRSVNGLEIRLGPIEAIDQTPVLDIKSATTDDIAGW